MSESDFSTNSMPSFPVKKIHGLEGLSIGGEVLNKNK